MGAKKVNQNVKILQYVLIAVIIASSIALIWQIGKITGAFTAANGDWENSVDISADNSTPEIRTHLIFGNYKPASCADGIYVESSGKSVQFNTENEFYADNLCSETDIVFANSGANTYNIYYGHISAQTQEQPAEQQPKVTEKQQSPLTIRTQEKQFTIFSGGNQVLLSRTPDNATLKNGTDVLSLVNVSDNNGAVLYIDNSNTSDYVDLIWNNQNILANSTINNITGYFEHNESTTTDVDVSILWFNGTDFESICSGLQRLSEGIDSCNLTSKINTVTKANSITIRYLFNRTAILFSQQNSNLDYANITIDYTNATTSSPPVNETTDWPMFHQNLAHAGYNPVDAPTNLSANVEYFNAGSVIQSSPAVANGVVYVGSYDDNKVYALNASNISQNLGSYTTGSAIVSSPAVANGIVYVGSNDFKVYALNASNISQKLGSYTTGGIIDHSSPAVSNGIVYIGSEDHKVYALNASNISQKLGSYTAGSFVVSSPAVVNGIVYVGSHDGKVYALNASNISQKLGSYLTGDVISSSPAVANGVVYVGGEDHKVYALNASNISQKLGSYLAGDFIHSSPAVANGIVYIGSDDGKVYALNASNISQKLGSYTTLNIFYYSSPAVANSVVYIGNGDNNIYALNASNMSQKLGSYTTGNSVSSSPAVANGVVYVGGDDGKVYAFGAATVADTTPPTWSNNLSSFPASYNASQPSVFNVTWADNVAVSAVLIEGNWSGSPQNYTATLISGTTANGVWSYNATLPAGTFYWKSYANDTSGNWNVTDTWNFAIQSPPAPAGIDLLPTSIETTPYGPEVGDGVTTEVVILNNGTNSSGEFNVTFFVDNNQECIAQNLTLENNTNLTTSCDWVIEEGGTHTINVFVDLENAVSETNELNNNLTDGVGSAWAGFQQGEQRRGVAHIAGPVNPPSLICSSSVSSYFRSAIFDGNQYYLVGFGGTSSLYAIDKTCTVVWSNVIGGTGLGFVGVESIPVVDAQGRVFVGSNNGNLYGFDTATGANWPGFPVALGGDLETSPVIVDGIVYIAGNLTNNGRVYAVDGATGSSIFNITISGEPIYSSIGYDDGYIYVGTDAGKIYKYDAKTGALAPNFPYAALSAVRSAIAIVGDTLYFQDTSVPVHVYAINKNTAANIWSPTSLTGCTGLADVTINNVGVVKQASLTVDGSKIYAECKGTPNLFVLDATTGSILNSATLSAIPGKACTLATVNNKLYCQDGPSLVMTTYGLNGNDLTTNWNLTGYSGWNAPTPGSVAFGDMVSNKFVIFGSPDLKPIESTYSPYGLFGGEMIYINYTIKNVDKANASAFNVSFYADNVFQEKKYVSGLDTNATTTLNFNATVNGDGPHDLKIIVDSDSNVAESDETNNKLTRTVAVNWAAFQQGPDHQGFSAVDFAPVTNNTKWIFNTSGTIFSSPIIANGVVYIGSDDSNVYAINITNGSKIWNYATGSIVRSTPAYYNGTIYVGSNNKKVYAFYENGSLRWNVSTTGAIGFASPMVSDGTVYIGNQAGTFYALNATTGSTIWSVQNGCGGGNAEEGSAPAVADNIVYKINNCNSGLQSRKTSDGSFIINFNGNIGGSTSAALDGDVIYRGDAAGKVFAYNRFNGTLIWNYSITSIERSSPAVAYGMVFIGEETNGASLAKVFALNATNGVQVWNYTTENSDIHSSPATAAGIVYISARNTSLPYQNTLYALNATTGSLIWKYAAPGLSLSSPAISPGSSILVVGLNYSILAFGTFDLIPLEMNVTPANLTVGQLATINVSVKDNGSIGVGWFNISLLVDNVEQSRQEAQLDFGMTQIYTFNWTAVFGLHNLTIAVDPDNVIPNESNENNNNITQEINVSAVPITACNLSVLIDGVNTTSFTNAGEPYNVTVNVTYTNGSAFDTTVNAIECNGLNQFALIQSIDSVFSNCDSAIVQTGSDGIISWTDVPTGGDLADSAGTYNITIKALLNGNACDEKSFTVVNRAPPTAAGQKTTNVPNRANIEGSNEQILVVFDRISRSRLSGAVAGETFDINIYDNGTAIGIPASINAGEPTGLNITVLNTSDVGIENVTVKAIEHSGLNHWALIQFDESNVSSEVTGTTHTDSNGNVRFTIVPTAGFTQQEVADAIGNYSVTLQAVLPNGTLIFNNTLTVDRTLPQPSPTEAVPNAGQIEGFNEMILVLFDRISKYI